jgi:H+/Cl- antiporter ClcA
VAASSPSPPGFGQFTTKKYILFQIEDGIDINILALIPCMMLGLLGGLLGSLFVFLNLKMAKLRRRVQAGVTTRHEWGPFSNSTMDVM